MTGHDLQAHLSELKSRREAASHGVIDFNERDWARFGDASDRAYTLIIFCNAKSKASASIKMNEHFNNFKLTSQHVKKAAHVKGGEHTKAADKMFFVAVEFDNAQRVFAQLGVQSVPWVIHFGPKEKPGCAATKLLGARVFSKLLCMHSAVLPGACHCPP